MSDALLNGAWHDGECDVCRSLTGCLRHGDSTACRWTPSQRIKHTPNGTYYLHGPEAPPLPGELPLVDTSPSTKNEFSTRAKQLKSQSATPKPPPPPWQPFPTEALPGIVARFIQEAAAAIGCDESFIALPLLAALASAIGATCRVRLRADWTEPPILWTAIVGDSGTQKSPAHQAATNPLERRQSQALRAHQDRLAMYDLEVERHKAALLEWRHKGIKKGEPPPEEPVEPIAHRLVVNDITVEAVAPILASHPRGVLLSRDELAGWFGSFGQYSNGKLADTAAWLSMHRGAPITIDRKGGQRLIHVPAATVSITGSIQPSTLAKALSRDHFENGLAARMLLAMPPRRAKRWTEASVSNETTTAIEDLFSRLLDLDFALSSEGQPEAYILPLTPDAKSEWIKFYNEHAEETASLMGDLAAAWSKIEGYAARLALVAALCQNPDATTIDVQSIQTGIRLARWFAREAARVYLVLEESPEEGERRRLVELIERKGGTITVRVLQGIERRFRASAELAEMALNRLAEAGMGAWEDIPTGRQGGRPGRVFRLRQHVSSQHNHQNPAGNDSSADADNADTGKQ